MHAHTKQTQAEITPALALSHLQEGNERFVQAKRLDRDLLLQVSETGEGQFPFAVILSCMDSRTAVEHIFDQGIGDVFSLRVAGNVLNDDILGSMEYACKAAGSKLVLVMGHTRCGAVIGACNGVELGNLTSLLQKVQPAIEGEQTTTENRTGSNPEFVQHVTELNVRHTIAGIRERSPILRDLEAAGDIAIAGAVYRVEDGRVHFFEEA